MQIVCQANCGVFEALHHCLKLLLARQAITTSNLQLPCAVKVNQSPLKTIPIIM